MSKIYYDLYVYYYLYVKNQQPQIWKFILWNWATDKYINIEMCVPQIKKLSEQASTTDV